jgi:Mg2+ and Co2+ transporter CorA
MNITKKHLEQLANIVARLHNDEYFNKDPQSIVIVENYIKNFAKDNCPNFDYDEWVNHVAKQIELDKQQDKKTMAFIKSLRKRIVKGKELLKTKSLFQVIQIMKKGQ